MREAKLRRRIRLLVLIKHRRCRGEGLWGWQMLGGWLCVRLALGRGRCVGCRRIMMRMVHRGRDLMCLLDRMLLLLLRSGWRKWKWRSSRRNMFTLFTLFILIGFRQRLGGGAR